jgi:hypothetical protein
VFEGAGHSPHFSRRSVERSCDVTPSGRRRGDFLDDSFCGGGQSEVFRDRDDKIQIARSFVKIGCGAY